MSFMYSPGGLPRGSSRSRHNSGGSGHCRHRCSGCRHSQSVSSGSGEQHHGHHHGHGHHGHRGHRAHRAHHDGFGRFDQFEHHNQFDNGDQFDFFDHNGNRAHQDQHGHHGHHENLHDADFGQSEELKYVNATYHPSDADLSEWELFEIAKDAIQNGSATVTENPVMNVRRLVWSIKVEGRFPTEAHVLNEAYAIFSRMQLDMEFERGKRTEIDVLIDRVTDGSEIIMQSLYR